MLLLSFILTFPLRGKLGVKDSEGRVNLNQQHQRLRHMSVKRPKNMLSDGKYAGSKSSDKELRKSSNLGKQKAVSFKQFDITLKTDLTREMTRHNVGALVVVKPGEQIQFLESSLRESKTSGYTSRNSHKGFFSSFGSLAHILTVFEGSSFLMGINFRSSTSSPRSYSFGNLFITFLLDFLVLFFHFYHDSFLL
ncbi:hypothetical protein ACOSP7_014661 [Xanthoceras sorbifolium]